MIGGVAVRWWSDVTVWEGQGRGLFEIVVPARPHIRGGISEGEGERAGEEDERQATALGRSLRPQCNRARWEDDAVGEEERKGEWEGEGAGEETEMRQCVRDFGAREHASGVREFFLQEGARSRLSRSGGRFVSEMLNRGFENMEREAYGSPRKHGARGSHVLLGVDFFFHLTCYIVELSKILLLNLTIYTLSSIE